VSIMDKKINFVVTLKSGDQVAVSYFPDFMNHLDFRGKISPTGYRSEFHKFGSDHPTLDEVKKFAGELAQELYDKNPAKYGTTQALF